MDVDSQQPGACELGLTGRQVQRLLQSRRAPAPFRDELRRRLLVSATGRLLTERIGVGATDPVGTGGGAQRRV